MTPVQTLKISIAMATYNGSKYLREQLDSFLTQTRMPDELAITDDCSTDNTLEIIQAFADTAPFTVYWGQNENNLGYTGNFNRALMKTKGDLVFFSDQDDIWFPEKLAIMERYALDNPDALVIMNDAALTDVALNDTGLTKQGQIKSAGMRDSSFVMGCCAAVRRELLDICLPIPAQFRGHDNWIVKMAEGVVRKHVVPDVLQWYRRHEENESQSIANSTTKVTRGMLFRRNLMNAIASGNPQEQLSTACDQALLFLKGVDAASKRADEPLAAELAEYSIELQEQDASLEQRKIVREKPRLMRLPAILNLWRSGGYLKFSGMKSVIRDLLFL